MPKERLLEKSYQRHQIYLHGTKPKIFIGSSVPMTKTGKQSNLQRNQLLLEPLIFNAT